MTNETTPAGGGGQVTTTTTTITPTTDITADLRRRRDASRRLPILESGRADPWFYAPPAAEDENLQGVIAAAQHLLAHDLQPLISPDMCRMLWRCGYRDLAERLARRGDQT